MDPKLAGEIDEELLAELMEMAQGGMAEETANRYGKSAQDPSIDAAVAAPPGDEGVAPEGPCPECGVEGGCECQAPKDVMGAEKPGGLDGSKMRGALAAMKAKGGF